MIIKSKTEAATFVRLTVSWEKICENDLENGSLNIEPPGRAPVFTVDKPCNYTIT